MYMNYMPLYTLYQYWQSSGDPVAIQWQSMQSQLLNKVGKRFMNGMTLIE